ncbi:MAG TPA: nitronate monooxygenase [Kiritimatiellia bacterium]|nr:nitronate monooxygenase [Kiritimatiellia bacterium]
MHISLPKIIQGGMGVGVSNWRLAQAVSRIGQLGIVSGTGLDQVLARRLQDGDLGGDVRRALGHFPFPQMAHRILDTLFIPGGKQPGEPYKTSEKPSIKNSHWFDELCIVSNFVEVFLAREGHSNPVGINYLEKIQLPHLPSAYGAMLAGAAVVIVGAGIPVEFPGVLDALSRHEAATYTIRVHGATPETDCQRVFDPALFIEDGCTPPVLLRPDFLPIISSDSLATMLLRRASGSVEGFVIEGPTAGGHNAPPRGPMQLSSDGQPIYGARDVVKLDAMRKIGMPFWLGGAYGSPEALRAALAEGAAGVQVGTPFALCVESGMRTDVRHALIRHALAGSGKVFTDPLASPTGFPFKVAQLEGTLSDPAVYAARRRVCDLGYLLESYRKEDGSVGYRCPAEPVASYVAKGGKEADTVERKCICNGLFGDIGLAQVRPDGAREPAIVTLGDDVANIGRFCTSEKPDYTAADAVRTILG